MKMTKKMMVRILFSKPLIPICVPIIVMGLSLVNNPDSIATEIVDCIVVFSLLLFINFCILTEESTAKSK